MKQEVSLKKLEKRKGGQSFCLDCAVCKVVKFEEHRSQMKTVSAQLYAKELENYFFYYPLGIKEAQ